MISKGKCPKLFLSSVMFLNVQKSTNVNVRFIKRSVSNNIKITKNVILTVFLVTKK